VEIDFALSRLIDWRLVIMFVIGGSRAACSAAYSPVV
jgi:hypothetical protein